MIELSRIVALDLETTGLSPSRGDRVIEIGALSIERGEVLHTFHTLVNVRRKIPWHASRVHGISDDMLVGQPFPENVYPAFFEYISGSILVAHNARFDLSFLQHEFGRFGMRFANHSVCTLQLARKRYPRLPNYRLATVAQHVLGSLPDDARQHRALDDAFLTARIWMAMEGNFFR